MFKSLVFAFLAALLFLPASVSAQSADGSVGIEGTIPTAPPAIAATISSPANGATFTDLPITVQGVCSGDLVIKLFRNGVFAGSAQCSGGRYSIQTDLFSGSNELVAIVFDALDQEGPPSNTITVNYDDNVEVLDRVALTSNFARRGADPNEELIWPVIVTGGIGPYAISVDWGDGQESLTSVSLPGEFNISHQYESSGVYTIIVKAVDSQGNTAFLQLIGVANGQLSSSAQGNSSIANGSESGGESAGVGRTQTRIIWQPILIVVPFVLLTFWLGTRHQLKRVRAKIEAGQLPFNLK